MPNEPPSKLSDGGIAARNEALRRGYEEEERKKARMRMKAKKAVWDVGHTHQHYRCVLDGLNAWKSKQASSEYKLPVRRKKVERRKIVDRKKLWTTGKGTHSLIRSLDLQVCSMFVGNSLSLSELLFFHSFFSQSDLLPSFAPLSAQAGPSLTSPPPSHMYYRTLSTHL